MHCLGVVGTSRASFSVYTSPDEITLLARALAGIHRAL
jgi:selenocysteine lyase/cysteine desulfurase